MTTGSPAAAAGPLVLGFPDYSGQARRLAGAAGLAYAEVALHRFPDGESRVRLPARLPPEVILCRSLQQPNDKLVELALTARTARELGAAHLTLVAPYLCYMRQDRAFQPGEAVSQRVVGRLLADWFDALVTVDPHLHRVKDLREAVPVRRPRCLTAAPLMGRFLARVLGAPLLIGPDEESRQWVSAIARQEGLDYLVGDKQRLGDREVRVRFEGARGSGRRLVLIDDVASTGRTLETAAAALRPLRPQSVDVLVTHALFLEGALERLGAAGVGRVWSTDSIPHPTNRLALAPLLAEALRG
jgi:ribose-phosphate pyrophosphokinase